MAGCVSVARADDPAPRKVALLVGVEKYLKPGFKDLQFAEDDVQSVAEELEKLGFDVTLLLGSGSGEQQATKANIEAAAAQMVQPLGKRDVALIMLSGHGQQLAPVAPPAGGQEFNFDKSQSYYCPVDARLNDPKSQVALNYLLDELLALDVGRKLVLVDACRDVPVDPTPDGKNAKGIEGRQFQLRDGTAVYFSCSAGQMSFEKPELKHGLFTHCVLEGLRGAAASPTGEISWSRLVAHVDDRMTQPDLVALMPANFQQVPILSGALPQTVLGRIEIKPVTAAPVPPQPTPPALEQSITSNCGLPLNLIPAGEFLMGSTDEEEGRHEDEGPQHLVRITHPFYIGVTEVTQSQYEAIMGHNPSYFNSAVGREEVAGLDTSDCPVEQVSWFDALEFCNRLSEQDGLTPCYVLDEVQREDNSIKSAKVVIRQKVNGYRLPTEAEWECACRAGSTTPHHFGFPAEGEMLANYHNDDISVQVSTPRYLKRTTSVGRYPPNEYGLYDMHGNVWEWCIDGFNPDLYASRTEGVADPLEVKSPVNQRVLRGGGWCFNYFDLRSARRSHDASHHVVDYIGFRVARSP